MKLVKHSNGYWYAHLRGRNPFSLKTKDESEAKSFARESKLQEMESARKLKILSSEALVRLLADRKITTTGALNEWVELLQIKSRSANTVKSYRFYVEQFLEDTGMVNRSIGLLSPEVIHRWVNRQDGLALSTKKQKLAIVSGWVQFLSDKGYVLGNPAALVNVNFDNLSFAQKEPRKKGLFTQEEIETLLSSEGVTGNFFWKHAILFADRCGLRLSDCVNMTWEQIDEGGIIVWQSKTNVRLVVPCPIESNPDRAGFMFPEQVNLYAKEHGQAILSHQFIDLCRKVGITGKSFHCLRHTFAMRHKALGNSIDEIRAKLGHTSSKTTETYLDH